MTEKASGAAARGSPCLVCGREPSTDPAKFWDYCLREKMGLASVSGTDCYRRGWQRLRAILKQVRAMIADDTTFPGAVLRVEIDRALGETSGASAAQPPSEKGNSDV